MKIAETTIEHLGGMGKLKAMIGAKDFFSDGKSLNFKFKGCRKANFVKITLNAADLYDVEFIKLGKLNKKTFEMTPNKLVGEFSGVGAESLISVFEAFTGLYLRI